MNRPFYAFGVLLALLALAMFAVGSSSRSTTVEAPPAAPADSLKTPLARLGTIYVVVLPAAPEPVGHSEPCATATADAAAMAISELQPIQVEIAGYDAALTDADCADCLSHYDPAYDHLVYGQRATAKAAVELAGQWEQAEDLVAMFHEFARPPKPRPALWDWPAAKLRVWTGQPTFRGVQNLFDRIADRLGWKSADGSASLGFNWHEYAELMDSLAGSAPNTATPISAPAAEQTVRSSDWMLHFAVSSLSQLGRTLQQAAAELQRLQFGTCDRSGD